MMDVMQGDITQLKLDGIVTYMLFSTFFSDSFKVPFPVEDGTVGEDGPVALGAGIAVFVLGILWAVGLKRISLKFETDPGTGFNPERAADSNPGDIPKNQ